MVEQVGGKHYSTGDGQIQHWDIIPGDRVSYYVGCASKYVSRHRLKGIGRMDVEKAISYLEKAKLDGGPAPEGGVVWQQVQAWAQNVPKLSFLDYRAIELMFCGKFEQSIGVMQRILEEDYPVIERGRASVLDPAPLVIAEAKSDDLEKLVTKREPKKRYAEMTDEELKDEWHRLEKANDAATSWGAAVGARSEAMNEITSLLHLRERRVPRYETETRVRERVGEVEQETTTTERSFVEGISLYPWQLTKARYSTLIEDTVPERGQLMAQFYKQVTPDIFRLEPVVLQHNLPRELQMCYQLLGSGDWVLDLKRLPEDLRSCYPRLQREMNMHEFVHSDEDYRFMYELDGGGKYVLRQEYELWGRE